MAQRTKAMEYLTAYGYLSSIDPKPGGIITADILSKAISDFQLFMGINATGIIDDESTLKMSLPRCGVKDKNVGETVDGSNRFVLSGSSWPNKNLTYKIGSYPDALGKEIVDQEIARAFDVWSTYTDLTFTPKSGQVDIDIKFERDLHDHECEPFDGPGHVLAHAFYPRDGGDVHFDKDEDWTVKSTRGINLFQVAVHEFGHALGLDHSKKQTSIMAPTYGSYNPSFTLDEDDINGIQAIYGPKTKTTERVD